MQLQKMCLIPGNAERAQRLTHSAQVELARYEREQSRTGCALPNAEALLLAAQQADAIYSRAFQELALQVRQRLSCRLIAW